MTPLHIAIVDDNPALAHALRQELLAFPELQEITIADSGLDFVKSLASPKQKIPDVVIMDISMRLPDEGIQAARMLHDNHPEIKVVMFTVAEDDSRVFDAFKAGAVGYLVKNEKPSFIYKTIIDVAAGGALMSPGIALKAIRFFTAEPIQKNKNLPNNYHLSERELEVLRLVAKGNTYLMIAEQLFISLETVKKHLSNIFKKLHVKNKIEAINKIKEAL
ncbi:MAG: response regulator transcription factor [Cyclobacteriaceae bacterium]|nr:response regulator transcription factor [Cyclobacteriaceae bacterium]